ncbi:SGNH/GDSL hydrolase family protein [uncultured Dubosiella sp.]|uniref:SGNH/GDSL hydrolase family protein n=3 Tax=uncultured Dubosiella sp. TaxID=1937011 RepID=UPI002080BABA|nr:SGNH/GDSL hydrolase family protein [uncultured Dubosiella sp.]GJM58125.1 hypothetical protein EROP_18180 [Erysipelotrichaceae bacterium OPF54]
MTRKPKKKQLSRKGIAWVCAVALLFVFAAGWHFTRVQATKPGRQYIHEQAQLDPQEISATLRDKKGKELSEMMESGKIDVLSAFDDYALFGDSRAYGFESYGVLDPNKVYADAGHTIRNITDQKDTIAQTKPSKLVFSYGVNDMGLDIGGNEKDGYRKIYEAQIDALLENDPDAQVFVCSIIDVTPQAKERSPRWDKAADFNAQIRQMCEDRGWTYVDNDGLGTDLSHYQEDGVHFTSDFTWEWARNIAKTIWETVYGNK